MGCMGSNLKEKANLKFLLTRVKTSSPLEIGKLKARLDKQ